MARQRNPKQTEKPTVTLEELPRGAEELTNEEAEATKGGDIVTLSPAQKAELLKRGMTVSTPSNPEHIAEGNAEFSKLDRPQ